MLSEAFLPLVKILRQNCLGIANLSSYLCRPFTILIPSNKVDFLTYKTKSANDATVTKKWVIVDAESAVLGRFASEVAKMIRGKHKPDFTPHVDCGDYVIVINADKIKLTGRKMTDKVYTRHTGYPGGQRFATPREWMAKHPTRVVEHAIKRMLPKSRLGSSIFNNLYVYAGPSHPHTAQQPEEVKLTF